MDISAKLPLDQDRQIGLTIRRLRQGKRMSQTALAERASVTFQQIQKYEKGVNRVSAGRLVQIAAALDVTVADLFGNDAAEGPAGLSREAMKLAVAYDRLQPMHRQAIDGLVKTLAKSESGK